MTQPVDIHALVGAYTLDALDDIERAAFTRHLTGCPECTQEVAELAEAAAYLANDVALSPPPGLRTRVLSEAARTPQVGPAPVRQVAPEPPSEVAPTRDVGRAPAVRRHRPIRWRPWVAGTVAASVLAVGASAATYVIQVRRVTEAERIQTVLTAPDAVTLTAPARGGGQVSIVLSPARDAAVVVTAGLTTPDRAHAYQLWLIDDGRATSAGVLAAGQAGGARYVTAVGAADQVGLTLEPAGGSTRPSLPILATLQLPG